MRISAMDSTAARASTSSSSRFRAGRVVCGLSFIFLFFLGYQIRMPASDSSAAKSTPPVVSNPSLDGGAEIVSGGVDKIG